MQMSELRAAGTWLPADLLAGDDVYVCRECGLAPVNLNAPRRPNPTTTLLEPGPPVPGDPLRRSSYRCRNREGCARRRGLRR